MTDARLHDTAPGGKADTALRLPRVVMPQPASGAISTARLPWRRIALTALIPWAVTRLAYGILAGIAQYVLLARKTPGVTFFTVWQRFDTNWYIGIATGGYYFPQQIAFFPLYPALIHLVSFVTGGNALYAALIVANLSVLTALIAIGALAAWESRDQRAAPWAMLAVLIYPFSFYLTAAYTEGLFLTFAILCLLFARQGRWRLTAVMALLAGATRPTGVALVAPLAWEWLRQQGLLEPEQWRGLLRAGRAQVAASWLGSLSRAMRRSWVGLLAVAAVPAFVGALGVFAGLRFKHPLLIVNVRRDYWGLVSAPVWRTIPREIAHMFRAPLGSDPQIIMVMDLLCLTLAAGAVIALVRRMPVSYILYMVSLLYLCVAQPAAVALQVLQGPGRYLVAAFPAFLGLGSLLARRPRLRVALICIGVAIQCYIAMRFLTGKLME
jgi:hypothetical protein